MGRKCEASLSLLLLHSCNRKEIKEFSPIQYSRAVKSGPSLSKLYHNCVVYHNLPHHIVKRLQRIQTACACFVVGKLVKREDIIKLNCMVTLFSKKKHIEWQLLKSVDKAIFSHEWLGYLRLRQFKHNRTLRTSAAMQLEISIVSHMHLSRSSC